MKSLKYYRKAAVYYTVIGLVNAYYWTITQTPWRQAKVLLAFKKYVESSWFTDRLSVMGKEYAVEQFFKHDYWFFMRQITKEEKLGILISPYTYIKEGRKATLFVNLIN